MCGGIPVSDISLTVRKSRGGCMICPRRSSLSCSVRKLETRAAPALGVGLLPASSLLTIRTFPLLLCRIRFVRGQSFDVKRFSVGILSPLSTLGASEGVNGMSSNVISSAAVGSGLFVTDEEVEVVDIVLLLFCTCFAIRQRINYFPSYCYLDDSS